MCSFPFTHPGLRSLARRVGLLGIIKRLRPSGADYEEKFSRALRGSVRPGDCVWDVGANVGYYTKVFSGLVGPGGSVQAFEPFASTFGRLNANLREAKCTNVSVHQVALGRTEEEVHVPASEEGGGVTNSLAGSSAVDSRMEVVRVVRGDHLVATGVSPPTVLKVDVEAFEEEVIDGLQETLRRPELRAVFCEVHFARLEERGLRDAPRRIEAKLRAAGFVTVWIDASHLGATHPARP